MLVLNLPTPQHSDATGSGGCLIMPEGLRKARIVRYTGSYVWASLSQTH